MKILLGTHVLIWWEAEPTKIPAKTLAVLGNPNHVLLASHVSLWEMLLKDQAGKPMIRGSVREMWDRQMTNGLIPLPIDIDHILGVEVLPREHKDPFDRLLIAQAIAESAALISADRVFARYPVPVLW